MNRPVDRLTRRSKARRLAASAMLALGTLAASLAGCSDSEEGNDWPWLSDAAVDGGTSAGERPEADEALDGAAEASDVDGVDADARGEGNEPSPCPPDMVLVEATCVDRFEAPNREGALPLVMLHLDEAESWCVARDKRLCFDDEWTRACEGTAGWAWVYGNEHEAGTCNDEETWISYNQELLNGWPWSLNTDVVESVDELLEMARSLSTNAAAAADHVEALYQGEGAGQNAGCVNAEGVFDLNGNVEEWTRRRDGGEPSFHGSLKGRYWAEARTCQQGVTGHGDLFRFYEIGFRCCRDPQ